VVGFAIFVFLVTSSLIAWVTYKIVVHPIEKLIDRTHSISRGEYFSRAELDHNREIYLLSKAINRMGQAIGEKERELNRQRDEYKNLFEAVPCLITVQNRDYKLLQFNRDFAEQFNPQPGDYCYHAYKGRTEKCEDCPVERTFEDGEVHLSEEKGVNRDGQMKYWIVRTSPVRNERGNVEAVMEMNLDITRRKVLEEQLAESEKKYYDIFNNIPNPVFVLNAETLEILDCNESVNPVYGFDKWGIIGDSFLELFESEDRERCASKIRQGGFLEKVKHLKKQGDRIYVNIRIAPSDYPGRQVLLVVISDITKRLEAEQQLVHAGKMATLGEMATGVAHELNQPLTVIKTASNFFMRKINNGQPIAEEVLKTMAGEIDSHVDRATKIIQHMRAFGRKTDLSVEPTDINGVLQRAFDIFSQQLKLREIEVVWDLREDLPTISADPYRLEQVFVNLLINARDAIEEKWAGGQAPKGEKRIDLATRALEKRIEVRVGDTGVGIRNSLKHKIFEPFFTTKKVGKGTGLGLSITYGIVKDNHGDIRAESREEGGTCFIIEFPIPSEADE
jgi:histidine kinase